jgi:hypothetical protein
MQQKPDLGSVTDNFVALFTALQAALEHVPPATRGLLEAVAQPNSEAVQEALKELAQLKAAKPTTNKE